MNFHQRASSATAVLPTLKKFFTLTVFSALLISLVVARAEGPDSDYLAIYSVMEQADALNTKGKTAAAHQKYLEAQRSLAEFRQNNSGWNSQMVNYRQAYLVDKIKETSGEAAALAVNDLSATKAKAGAASKSAVKLISAGSEPRTVLRLHPAVGDQQTVLMTTKMKMTMAAAGNEMPAMDMPAMTTTMSVEVKKVSADGLITYAMSFGETDLAAGADSKSPTGAAMKAALGNLSGLSGEGQITDRGIVKTMEMKDSGDNNPLLAQTMEQMKDSANNATLPLPEEAVGTGAKWEHKTKIKSQGLTVDQVTTVELISGDSDRLELKSTITQNAAGQKIENSAMPGMKMDLIKLVSIGKGKSSVDLGHLLPISATVDSDADTTMTMNGGQQKQMMTTKLNVVVKFEQK
jgi:hypothetical protein